MPAEPEQRAAQDSPPPQVPLYAKGSREEEAELSLKRTNVGRPVAWTLCAAFLLTVFSELAVQHVLAIRRAMAAGEAKGTGDTQTGNWETLLPRAYSVVDLLPRLGQVRAARSLSDYWKLLPPEQRIKDFDASLEEASVISACVRPRTQAWLTGLGGAGNEKAYCGRGPWLFYRPEVDYLTGPGILEPAVLRQRSRGGRAVQPDPRAAIVDFGRQLKTRGIDLILMPVPSKPMIHPEHFTARFDEWSGALQNASYEQFRKDVEAAGVVVCDVTGSLIAAKHGGATQFLETDTHWTPEAMEAAARQLAAVVGRRVASGAGDAGSSLARGVRAAAAQAVPAAYRQETRVVENLGDIAVMLKLPPDQRIYAPQRVTIHPVVAVDGRPWQPSPAADVLLLGDSYANIYSVGAMGWGEGAGLAEQLSFALQGSVDRISRNDSGAFATREMLQGELARGHNCLAGKKVVVWEFAMRELSAGDWKLVELPAVPAANSSQESLPAAGEFLDLPPGRPVLVTGTVAAASSPPRANSPYKDYLMQFHLVGLRAADGGQLRATQALVFVPAMQDHKILAPAHWKPGRKVTLRLSAWSDAAKRYDALRRSELEGDFLLEPLCFGEDQP